MSTTVWVADQVVADDHHGFDSFEETLREDLEHIFFREAAHFHSFTSAAFSCFSLIGMMNQGEKPV
jgi:hypothetical protein